MRKRPGTSARSGSTIDREARALLSFLESHGFPSTGDEAAPSGDDAVRRLAGGPVPPSVLAALAEGCGVGWVSLIERASELSRRVPAIAGSPSSARAVDAAAGSLDGVFARVFESLGEERGGQLEVARAVDRALREGGIALVEAGTGTGKSLGYLVPAALYSLETGERVIVSTHTKNLQDQLRRREMPLLESILGGGVRAERLLGRENYLCPRNIVSFAGPAPDGGSETRLAFALHLSMAGDGTLESIAAPPSGMYPASIAAPRRCPMNACAFADRCPLLLARKRAREAGILFVNHALLLTDYRRGGGVIGPYARVIFDEAHHLERCVMENLSVHASRDDVRRILEPIRIAERNEDAWRLLAHEISSAGRGGDWKHLRRDVSRAAKEMERSYADLFRAVEESLNPAMTARATKTRYTDGGETFALARGAVNRILADINKFNELLKPINEMRLPRDLDAFQQEAIRTVEELSTLAESIGYLSAGADEESVFWLEWGTDASLRELCGSPLGIDRPFADYLESFLGSAVFTSATLSQGGSFSFARERLGLELLPANRIETVIPSPFPFDENCLVLIVTGLGDPNGEDFAASVSSVVGSVAAAVGRRLMVLFTSYRLCHSVARGLGNGIVRSPVLVQGAGESREALSDRFRRSSSAVLLGVASFWEGVDFPGEELEILVIPKVPFPVPSEPIVEARSARLAALGEDPFEKLFLPEAILRMRQGAGRLIRRMDDRGVIIILDERLETRPYGPAVLASLPSRRIGRVSSAECIEAVARWFEAP